MPGQCRCGTSLNEPETVTGVTMITVTSWPGPGYPVTGPAARRHAAGPTQPRLRVKLALRLHITGIQARPLAVYQYSERIIINIAYCQCALNL